MEEEKTEVKGHSPIFLTDEEIDALIASGTLKDPATFATERREAIAEGKDVVDSEEQAANDRLVRETEKKKKKERYCCVALIVIWVLFTIYACVAVVTNTGKDLFTIMIILCFLSGIIIALSSDNDDGNNYHGGSSGSSFLPRNPRWLRRRIRHRMGW